MKKLLEKRKVVKTFSFEIKAVNETDHIIEGVFSTPDIDRHNESVQQSGWDLSYYKTNPVVLWAHDAWEFPIAQMVDIFINDEGNLAGKMKFAVEEYEKAATAYALMVGKYLRAFSVGFSNNKYEVDQENDVVNLVENELLEVSVVNIPANQMALAKAKSDGIDVSAFEIKDDQEIDNKENQKQGKVLSAKNRKAIEVAIGALNEVLAADDEDKNFLRADTVKPNKKVETPLNQGSQKNQRTRKLNKIIRLALREKAKAKIV